jgi:hypothetical protein
VAIPEDLVGELLRLALEAIRRQTNTVSPFIEPIARNGWLAPWTIDVQTVRAARLARGTTRI